MTIAVECVCGGKFRVKDESAGKMMRCPNCQALVPISAASGKPPGNAPAPVHNPAQGNPQQRPQQRPQPQAAPVYPPPGVVPQSPASFGYPTQPMPANAAWGQPPGMGYHPQKPQKKFPMLLVVGGSIGGFLVMAIIAVVVTIVIVKGNKSGNHVAGNGMGQGMTGSSSGTPFSSGADSTERKPGQLWFSISNVRLTEVGDQQVQNPQTGKSRKKPVLTIAVDCKYEQGELIPLPTQFGVDDYELCLIATTANGFVVRVSIPVQLNYDTRTLQTGVSHGGLKEITDYRCFLVFKSETASVRISGDARSGGPSSKTPPVSPDNGVADAEGKSYVLADPRFTTFGGIIERLYLHCEVLKRPESGDVMLVIEAKGREARQASFIKLVSLGMKDLELEHTLILYPNELPVKAYVVEIVNGERTVASNVLTINEVVPLK